MMEADIQGTPKKRKCSAGDAAASVSVIRKPGAMEVPEEVLQVLKCSRCEGLLSCGPVYLCLKGGGLCNSCYSDEADSTATRNTHYEAVAELLLFPCKNKDEGCKVKIPFNNPTKHEEECPHRKYACPLQSSSVCEWSGTFGHILDHCKDQHSDKVLDSPTTFTHDITKFSSNTYLLRALELLFLLFTKVCVTSGKIYYSIRHIGISSDLHNFKYNLTITRKNETLIKEGQVDPQECLATQEDSSLIIKINSLLDILGGFDDTTFTVTMQHKYLGGKCSKCGVMLKVKEYYDSDGWKCVYCAPSKECCSYNHKGCSFQTFPKKLEKHHLFCDHNTYCRICYKHIVTGKFEANIMQHYKREHLKESAWQTVEKSGGSYLISSDAGPAMCKYEYSSQASNFNFYVFIPVSNDQLSNFRCTVKIIELASCHIRTYTPNISYNMAHDWLVTITKEDFNDWSESFVMSVCISKIK